MYKWENSLSINPQYNDSGNISVWIFGK